MIFGRNKTVLLFIGDIFFLYITLLLMLLWSYFPFPEERVFFEHLTAFSLLIALWVLVFFIAGFYEKTTLFSRRNFTSLLLKAQSVNIVIAVFFFYFIPFFGITPKTNLFFYLIVSFLLLAFWRLYITPFIQVNKKPLEALLIAPLNEIDALVKTINNNPRYGIAFSASYDINALNEKVLIKIRNAIEKKGITYLVVDMGSEHSDEIPFSLYNFLFTTVHIVDMSEFCEDLFGKVPISSLSYRWFLEHIPETEHPLYDFFKRGMDIVIGVVLGTLSLLVYPLVYLAVVLDDGGPLFFHQVRIGKNGKKITISKFRSIKKEGGLLEVTRVGFFLRATRLDEVPQLWNIVKGDLSLIGPRPEIPELVSEYTAQIPYYNTRHLIKPGLSGWAQIFQENHPHHIRDVEATKEKLSYDLYYIKNRSLLLDVIIALKTIRTLLSRKGK